MLISKMIEMPVVKVFSTRHPIEVTTLLSFMISELSYLTNTTQS